jgi:hypothetical protein
MVAKWDQRMGLFFGAGGWEDLRGYIGMTIFVWI